MGALVAAAGGLNASGCSLLRACSESPAMALPAVAFGDSTATTTAYQFTVGNMYSGWQGPLFDVAIEGHTLSSPEHSRPWDIHGSLQLVEGASSGLRTEVLVRHRKGSCPLHLISLPSC